ncbi:MFS transporter [Fictibacillus iocasae]|uniref:MFS transporter n=1 Tax=Fictibacillus iocasae TaxID=2715437 RepID=A0ABW2NV87_9BACL
MSSTKPLLSLAPYRYLISAQLISNLGDWLSIMAIFTMAGLKWNATPLEMSLILLSLAVPMTVLGPVAGVLADRTERKVLMIGSDLARVFVMLLFISASEVWHVYILMFLLGVFSALFNPAKNGKLKEIVPDEHMQQANSISSIIENGTKIVGPAAGGALMTFIGTDVIYMIDAATFLLSALLLMKLPVRKHSRKQIDKDKVKTAFWSELSESLTFIKGVPFIFYGLFLTFVAMFVIQLADSQFVTLFRELKEVSPSLLGAVMTSSGAGFLVSGLLLSKLEIKKPAAAMAAGIIVLGAGFGLVGYLTYLQAPSPYFWASAVVFATTFGAGFMFIPFQTGVQQKTPVEMSGRVFGTVGSVTMFAAIIGPLASGIIGNMTGVLPLFLTSGFGLVFIGMVALILRRHLEKDEEHGTESIRRAQGTTTT